MRADKDTVDTRLYNKELGSRLDDGIKKAFTFPFYAEEHCKPDCKTHVVPDRTFHLNGHLVVLYNINLFPGITFRALEANTGDLNVFTQDVKFEIDMPTIGGYFYVVSEDKSVKPVHVRGSFKINYDTVIAKGITSFFLNINCLGLLNMAIDFELVEKPRVTLYSHEADGSMGELDSNRKENGAKVAEVLWPSVHSLLYWLLRDKLWTMCSAIPWTDRIRRNQFSIHEKRRRSKVSDLLNDIITKVKRKLREKTIGGRLEMPDIDVMVASRMYPDVWGRFKATSGWLGNLASMRVNDHTAVHARSKNELVIVGQINFHDWKYCYDEYTMEANIGNATGEIIRTLRDNEASITITAIRNGEGEIVTKHGRVEYINATNVNDDITRLGDFDILKLETYIKCWMSGLMDAGKPVLNKTINDCLNEVLIDVDMFAYWDELNAQGVEDENAISQDSSEDEDYVPDGDCQEVSEDDSTGNSINNDWEIM